jgi:hypothetical protein
MLKDRDWRWEGWTIGFVTVGFFLYNSAYWMWWGGACLGPRHLIPILYLLGVPLCFSMRRQPVVTTFLCCISITTMIVASARDFRLFEVIFIDARDHGTLVPWTYYPMKEVLGQDWLPNLGTMVHLSTWMSLLPLVALWALAAVLMRSVSK